MDVCLTSLRLLRVSWGFFVFGLEPLSHVYVWSFTVPGWLILYKGDICYVILNLSCRVFRIWMLKSLPLV